MLLMTSEVNDVGEYPTEAPRMFATRKIGSVLFLTPLRELSEGTFFALHEECNEIHTQYEEDPSLRHILVNGEFAEFFGSSALGFFVRLWKRVCWREGELAFCNLSEMSREILHIARLDLLWKIYDSPEMALEILNQESEVSPPCPVEGQ